MSGALVPVAAHGAGGGPATLTNRVDLDLAFLDTIEAELELAQDYDPWTGREGQARPAQLPPAGEWAVWLIMAGRGFGKTRSGAEFVRQRIQAGIAKRITLTGPTHQDTIDIMVEGESGLLEVCNRAGIRYRYVPSKRRIYFPDYGARALLVSADRPDRYRGRQHDTIWADELAAWRYADDAWNQMMLGLRIGVDPRAIATTTPRPTKFMKALVKDNATTITGGTSYENMANLHERYKNQVIKRYEGTTLGRQELEGKLLLEVEGAFWGSTMLENNRVTDPDQSKLPQMRRIVIGVDPATTSGEDSDATAIVAAGLGVDGKVYVLRALALRESPHLWARAVIGMYDDLEADLIAVETNQGGDMVVATINNATNRDEIKPKVKKIHAKRGKSLRAQPVVALYEQGQVRHVGMFAELEDQMCSFTGNGEEGEDDDLVDALVYAITEVHSGPRSKGKGY